MQVYNKKSLTNWFIRRESTKTQSTSKHDRAPRLPTVIKGLKLTGVTPVATNDQRSQASHL
jgi:hypothetical protein